MFTLLAVQVPLKSSLQDKSRVGWTQTHGEKKWGIWEAHSREILMICGGKFCLFVHKNTIQIGENWACFPGNKHFFILCTDLPTVPILEGLSHFLDSHKYKKKKKKKGQDHFLEISLYEQQKMMQILLHYSHWCIVIYLAMKNLPLIMSISQTSTLWILLFLDNIHAYSSGSMSHFLTLVGWQVHVCKQLFNKFLLGIVPLRGELLQIDEKNVENFKSALYMKSGSIPLTFMPWF